MARNEATKQSPVSAEKSRDGIFGRGSLLKAALPCGETDPKRLLIPEKFRRPDRFHDSLTCPRVGRLGAFQCGSTSRQPRRVQAARHSYRWCSTPTSGVAMIFPKDCTVRGSGESFSNNSQVWESGKCLGSMYWATVA